MGPYCESFQELLNILQMVGVGLYCEIFPECIAKGSCFLSWGSGGGGLFAGRFRAAVL
jgi:hypothetical protein